jgi:MFS family permease
MRVNFVMLLGYALTIYAELWAVFAGRVILGLGVGSYCVYCIKFVSELAPIEYRGPIGAVAELSIATGRWFPSIGGLFINQADPQKSLFIPRLLWGFPLLMLIA